MKLTPAFALLFLVFAFLYGCNENPTTPEQTVQFDSARYSWERIELPYQVRDFCAVDTNDIYMFPNSGQNFITYKNRQFLTHPYTDPDFKATSIGSVGSNVYIGGSNQKNARPMIQKWNGSNLENIPLPEYNPNFHLLSAFPMPNGEIWFTGSEGNLIRYAGNNIYHHRLDSSYYFIAVNYVNDEIYATGIKSDGIKGGSSTVRIHRYQNGIWNVAWEQTFNAGEDLNIFFPFINSIENHLYGQWRIGEIYEFNGSNLVKVLTLPEMIINVRAAGHDLTNFTFPGWRDDYLSAGDGAVFNWNGNKLSIELRIYQAGYAYTTILKNNSYLVLCETESLNYASVLYIGKR